MWRYGVPVLARRGKPPSREEVDEANMAKFEDADEDALPLDRPHAPNYVDLRKFLRKGSSAERYADRSSSNDEDCSLGRMLIRDVDDANKTARNMRLPKSVKNFGHTKSCLHQHHSRDTCDCVMDSSTTAEADSFGCQKAQQGPRTVDEERMESRGSVQKSGNTLFSAFVTNSDCATFKTTNLPSTGSGGNIIRNESAVTTKSEGINTLTVSLCNVLSRAYHFTQFMFVTVFRMLRSVLILPFQVLRGRRIQRLEFRKTSKDFTPSDTSSFIALEDKKLGSTKGVEKRKNTDLKKSEPYAIPNALPGDRTSEFNVSIDHKGSLTCRKSSKTVFDGTNEAEWIAFVKPHVQDSDEEIDNQTDKKQGLFSPLKLSVSAPKGSSMESPADEDGDVRFRDRIGDSEKWMDEIDDHPRLPTPTDDAASPLGFETSRQLQVGNQHGKIELGNKTSLYPLEQKSGEEQDVGREKQNVAEVSEESERHVLIGGTIHSPEEWGIRRRVLSGRSQHTQELIEMERQESMEQVTGTQGDSKDASLTDSGNFDSQFFGETDDSSTPNTPQQASKDPFSAVSPQGYTPDSIESRRRTPIRAGIKNDVKAVTESVRRALLRNKPEPDTRFTSPRSAQKTLLIVADVMTKEFNCMVAMRRSGALKLRSEKTYASDAKLRISLRFQPLDAFSCNVIICRSRDDDFTVPTSDYVTFIAGLQQTFLNNVTGAWRYQ